MRRNKEDKLLATNLTETQRVHILITFIRMHLLDVTLVHSHTNIRGGGGREKQLWQTENSNGFFPFNDQAALNFLIISHLLVAETLWLQVSQLDLTCIQFIIRLFSTEKENVEKAIDLFLPEMVLRG